MSELKNRINKLENDPKLKPDKDNRIVVFLDGVTNDPETGEKITKEDYYKKYGESDTIIVVKYEDKKKLET